MIGEFWVFLAKVTHFCFDIIQIAPIWYVDYTIKKGSCVFFASKQNTQFIMFHVKQNKKIQRFLTIFLHIIKKMQCFIPVFSPHKCFFNTNTSFILMYLLFRYLAWFWVVLYAFSLFIGYILTLFHVKQKQKRGVFLLFFSPHRWKNAVFYCCFSPHRCFPTQICFSL